MVFSFEVWHAPSMKPASETFVVFRLGAARLALSRGEVLEILPLPRLLSPAGAPSVLAGYMNVGGEALAIIRLGRLLDPQAPLEEAGIYSHIIRLAPAGRRMGLLVDRVEDAAAEAQALEPVEPSDSLNGALAANIRLEGQLCGLLSSERLLNAHEAAKLQEMTEMMQERLRLWDGLDQERPPGAPD